MGILLFVSLVLNGWLYYYLGMLEDEFHIIPPFAFFLQVLAAAYRQVPGTADFVKSSPRGGGNNSGSGGWHLDLKPTTARAHLGAAAMDGKHSSGASQQHPSSEAMTTPMSSMTVVPVPMLRMLFSATLSENPQKLAALGLINPKFYALASKKSSTDASNQNDDDDATAMVLPATLNELVLKVSAGSNATVTKPLLLLALLRRILEASPHSFVLVFASSLDSTHRLARLLQLAIDNGEIKTNSVIKCLKRFDEVPFCSRLKYIREQQLKCLLTSTTFFFLPGSSMVFEYSGGVSSLSHVQAQQQKLARNRFKSNAATTPSSCKHVRVVVSSDGLARGVDLPGVSHVLNYDAPTSVQVRR